VPFVDGPPAPKPKDIGTCTPCGEVSRVWKFAEQEVSLTAGYSAILSYAICRACLEVVLDILDAEDDDAAGPASTLPD
jgi:hypothetical protein